MYSRPADASGAPEAFGVSGKLWNGVLVMYDRSSGSLWSQLDGAAIDGPKSGESLEHLDSVQTTWEAWRRQHPETLVLLKPESERERRGSLYSDYLEDPEALFLPELREGLGGVAPKDVVYGVRIGGDQTAVTESLLSRVGLVNGTVGLVPVVWILDETTGAVHCFDRRFEGQVVVLAERTATGKLRDAFSGFALSPDALQPVPVDRAFWYGWKRTFPASRVIAD